MWPMSQVASDPVHTPIATLATTDPMNETVASTGPGGRATAWTAIAKRTSPVPSLNRLSPSTIVASARDARSGLNVATTAAGSVADTIAPTRNARSGRSPVMRFSTIATTAAETSTPGTASSSNPLSQRRSSSRRRR